MEEFFLRGFFFCKKLNVVDYKHVYVSVTIAKFAGTRRRAFSLTDYGYKVVGEFFAGGVKYVGARRVGKNLICYCVHYVRFTKPRSAVNKQRVIAFTGFFGNGFRRRIQELVGSAYYERIESVFGVDFHGAV